MKVTFNSAQIQNLLDYFHTLFQVRVSVFDQDFNELYSNKKTSSSFCFRIRQNKEANEFCLKCHKKAFKLAKNKNKIHIYKCHMGLYEFILPINYNDKIVGYFMAGQIVNKTEKEKSWLSTSKKSNFTNDVISIAKNDYHSLKQMNQDEIIALSQIIKICSKSITIDVNQTPLSNRIEQYVMNHYSEKITTEKICTHLNISKSTIYNTLKKECNMSLTKYINNYRLLKSTDLLKSADFSISEIATKVGFENYNYYSRIFKKEYKKTPSAYRKLN